MRNFRELTEANGTVVFTFGRFNPPTTGHEKLVQKVASVSGSSPFRIYPSYSQNPKKDPLPFALKIAYMRKMFPKYARNIVADKDARTAINIAVKLYDEGFENLIMVAGSDRVKEFQSLLNTYNGVEGKRHGFYKFDTIDVVSAGERDPDAEGVAGMSASKMRAAASAGDFDSFKTGLPSGFRDAQKLYNDVRKYMGIREERDMGEMSDFESLRDNYLTGKLWNIGDLVEANGVEGRIIRKGTNYVAFCDSTGKVHKAWLHEVELDERNYANEYKNYHSRPEQIARRSSRNKAQRLMGTVDGMDVHHKDNNPLNNDPENLAHMDRSENRREPRLREREVKQDKDVKDREGTQPAKYYAKDTEGDAMAKSTKQARARHFAKYGKKDPDSDAAYKPAPGDKGGTTKPSKHTKKFKQMFGEEPRVPRKKGQPAKSDKHSDLYTDEDPRGTIHGLGFKDVETAKASVSKIERSDRTHAHKIQAAVAMEQRAKEMGKKAEASIYRTYINKMKEKTKKMNEGLWDNIRKKKERIKRGSGEKMRKKGEKGAPTSAQMKRAQEEAPDTTDAMKRYKSGKAGFTDIAHLKAKGLIKRADGTKRKSDKYEMTEEFKFYPDDLKDFIKIPDFPRDDMQREMGIIRKFISTRTDKDEESVANNDRDSFYSIKQYLKKMKVEFHENELRDIVQQAVPTIRHFKNKFNRKRPFEIDGNLDVLGSTTNKTRSYPSGHSTQAMIVALYVAQKFPEHKDGLMEAAKEVGIGRVKAGFHFLSDHVAGQMLGTKMFEQMNKGDYGDSLREYYLLGTPEYDKYLRKLTPGEKVKENINEWGEIDEDAEYQGKKVKLNNPVRGGNKKFYVYVKNDKGNVVKVSFGDTTGLSIKRDDPERRKAFRARHNCDQKKDKTTPGYWSCKFWEKGKSVTDLMKG